MQNKRLKLHVTSVLEVSMFQGPCLWWCARGSLVLFGLTRVITCKFSLPKKSVIADDAKTSQVMLKQIKYQT